MSLTVSEGFRRRGRTAWVAAALVAATVAGCSRSGPPRGAATPIPAPAAPGSREPGLTLGADGTLYLSWIASVPEGAALEFSRWTGEGWSPADTVAVGGDWLLNPADPPALNALADGTLIASHAVLLPGGGTAERLELNESRDGGKTWPGPVVPHPGAAPAERGFVTLFPIAPDTMGMVWLDGRAMAARPDGASGGDSAAGEPAMALRFTTLTREGTLGDDTLLDPRACDCCATGAVRLDDGTLVVVYRDRSAADVRDVAVIRRVAGAWSEPTPVHDDGWRIVGCPVNGPALAALGSEVAVAWYTQDSGGRPHVRVAFSTDGGAGFGPAFEVGEATPLGRVDVIVADDGSAWVSWVEQTAGDAASIRLRRVAPDGERDVYDTVAPTTVSRAGGYPKLARWKDEMIAAWTEVSGDTTRVATAAIR